MPTDGERQAEHAKRHSTLRGYAAAPSDGTSHHGKDPDSILPTLLLAWLLQTSD